MHLALGTLDYIADCGQELTFACIWTNLLIERFLVAEMGGDEVRVVVRRFKLKYLVSNNK